MDTTGTATVPVSPIRGHYDGDVFTGVVAYNTTSGYWFSNSGTSSSSSGGYAIGYAPSGFSSTSKYPTGSSVSVLASGNYK